MEEYQLADKTIIISGAGSGIGKETAKYLAGYNANLILIGRNLDKLEITKKIIAESSSSSKVCVYECDISSNQSLDDCFLKIEKNFDSIYGLVNNAGINPSRDNLTDTNISDWEKIINTNLSGTYLLTKKVIPLMIKNKMGSIVNISSIAGILGMKKRFSYSVTKSALSGFTKSVSTDYAKFNIRSNCICPGYIKTSLTKDMLDSLNKEDLQNLIDKHPLGLGKEHFVAAATKFLLSEEAQWITGAIIPVDGGYSLGRD